MKRYTVIGLVDSTGYTVSWAGRARDHWHAFKKAARWFDKTEGGAECVTLVACVPALGQVETPCESGATCAADDYLAGYDA